MHLPKTTELRKQITGQSHNYSDGEIWPSLREMDFNNLKWMLSYKLGLKNRLKGRQEGKLWPAKCLTMIGDIRAQHIVDSVASLESNGIKGNLVDVGVWRGGSTILMASAIAELEFESPFLRYVYCCDTFSGFSSEDALYDNAIVPGALKVSLDKVMNNTLAHLYNTNSIMWVEGKIQDTASGIEGPIALLRLDVDLSEPTYSALVQLYPKVSKGGIIIIDDYGDKYYSKCCSVVDLYRAKHNITDPIIRIDDSGVYWRKS